MSIEKSVDSLYDSIRSASYTNPAPPQATGAGPQARQEPERICSIAIRQLDHGYIIEVGCKTIVIESAVSLITYLSSYILQPDATHKMFFEGKLFNR